MRWHPGVLLAVIVVAAAQAQAQQETLLIGPGDMVHVQVLDTPELDETARVTDQGTLPMLSGGSIRLAALTPEQAARAVEASLVQNQVMHSPRVLVTVTHYATGDVSLFGQVNKPGAYAISTARPLVDVLTLAAGFTDLADHHVVIERANGGGKVTVFVPNTPTDHDEDVLVHPGDRVIVPKASLVYVLGDVGRAGGFPMNDNHSSLTILQALALAGGAPATAAPDHARLLRHTPDGGYTEIRLHLHAMQKGKEPDQTMRADDVVYVPFSYIREAALGASGILGSVASAAVYVH